MTVGTNARRSAGTSMSWTGCIGDELTTGRPHIGTAGVAAMARQAERGAKLRLPRAALERVLSAERVVGDDREPRAPAGGGLERARAIGECAGIVVGVVDAGEQRDRPHRR